MRRPTTNDFLQIAAEFEEVWNLPHCIGAIDGKHLAMQAAPNSGSLYFNYKHYHSVVMMAVCDANYLFTMVNSGAFGSARDGGIFARTDFGAQLLGDGMPLPRPSFLPN